MIHKATQEINDAFLKADLKCTIQETNDTSLVRAGASTDNCQFEALFLSRDEDNDVSMRIFNITKFPADKTDAVFKAVNECNTQYRFLRFSVDTSDNTVSAGYDFPVSTDNIGALAVELFVRSMQIVGDCYPVLMRAIYA